MIHIDKIKEIEGIHNIDCIYFNNNDYSKDELIINSLVDTIRRIEYRLNAALVHDTDINIVRSDIIDLIDESVDELEEVLNER